MDKIIREIGVIAVIIVEQLLSPEKKTCNKLAFNSREFSNLTKELINLRFSSKYCPNSRPEYTIVPIPNEMAPTRR